MAEAFQKKVEAATGGVDVALALLYGLHTTNHHNLHGIEEPHRSLVSWGSRLVEDHEHGTAGACHQVMMAAGWLPDTSPEGEADA